MKSIKEEDISPVKSSTNLPLRCEKIIVKKNRRCERFSIKGSTFCSQHMPNSTFTCEGLKSDGTKCGSFKRPGSKYCCDRHDPELGLSDPIIFREDNLRDQFLAKLLFKQNHQDCYSEKVIEAWKEPISNYHIDHFVELNLVRDLFDKMKIQDPKEKQEFKNDLKITFNQEFNLGLTDEKINMAKSAAMQSFGSDYRFKKVHEDGIRHYMRNSTHMKTRSVVTNIVKEVANGFEAARNHISSNIKASELNDRCIGEISDVMESLLI